MSGVGNSSDMLCGLLLAATMSTDYVARKGAEKSLSDMEGQQGFTIGILGVLSSMLTSTDQNAPALRLGSAVVFKNAIRRRWVPADDSDCTPIPDVDRDVIKANLVDLMCSAPKNVQNQLGEAVSLIAKHDFPAKWNTLLAHLVSKLQNCQDLYVINGVMSTASSLFKRYRYALRTDSLFMEIKFCLEGFQVPLLEMYKSMCAYVKSGQLNANKVQLELVMETIYQMTRIFWSLNSQDLPEYFEDHMAEWMTEFADLLTYSNPILVDENEENETGVLERVKAAVIENINLYATKYEEEFSSHLPRFTELIWKLLVAIPIEPKYDSLATQAIKFLTSVCGKQTYSSLFTDAVLKDIVHSIVVKNMLITERDEELFEENPFDYIRKDMEGSDQETRRRCAMDLVRSLLKLFSTQTSKLCVDYVGELMNQYQRTNDWKLKDTALQLILSVSVLTSSNQYGANELNSNVNILDLFNVHVLPELSDMQSLSSRPIVKADVIKLICMFRNHLDAAQLSTVILPLLIRYLISPSVVIQTYAALSIEKILALKQKENKAVSKLTKEHVNPYLQELFGNLFHVLETEQANAENDYLMKCVMRVLLVIGEDMIAAVELISNKLTNILVRVCKNPINPQFNHCLFECIAIMIRSGCERTASGVITTELVSTNCSKFEGLLFPTFQFILSSDISEFTPYVFQLLAQLLYYRPAPGLSEAYKALVQPLLSPALWERKGNIPALTELFQSYIVKGMDDIVAGGHLPGLLGVFQKLLFAKSTEQNAFTLLNLMLKYSRLSSLEQFIPTILQLVLNKLMTSKTPKFNKLSVHMFCVFAVNFGAETLYQFMEKIQANLLVNVLGQIYAPAVPFIVGSLDVVTGCELCLGTMKLLTGNIPSIRDNTGLWTSLLSNYCSILVKTSSLAGVNANKVGFGLAGIGGDEGFNLMGGAEGESSQDFDSAYSKLSYAAIAMPNKIVAGSVAVNGEIEPYQYVSVTTVQLLGQAMQQNPGKFTAQVLSVITHASNAEVVHGLFKSHNVPIV